MKWQDVVLHSDVRLLPRRVGRRGCLLEADIAALVYFEGGTQEGYTLTLVRTDRSWRLLNPVRPQGMKDGRCIGVQDWIAPEVFASIRMRAIEQAQRFEGRS